jgi:hypothetical protein
MRTADSLCVESQRRELRPGPRWIAIEAGQTELIGSFPAHPTPAGRETSDLRSGPALARVEFDSDASSWREDSSEHAHQWVAVRSTLNDHFLTFGEVELQPRTSGPINCEPKIVAPWSGGNRPALAVFDPCHGVAVDQNSIRPSRIQPSPCGSVDRDLSARHRRIVGVVFRLVAGLIVEAAATLNGRRASTRTQPQPNFLSARTNALTAAVFRNFCIFVRTFGRIYPGWQPDHVRRTWGRGAAASGS